MVGRSGDAEHSTSLHRSASSAYGITLPGVDSGTMITLPRHVTHVPHKTKLLPWTSPVKSVMVVISPQWGHQTFCKIRSWQCEGIASQSNCAAGVHGGCIGWRPWVRMCSCVTCADAVA